MHYTQELLFHLFLVVFVEGSTDFQEYAVDVDCNLTIPCPIPQSRNVQWSYEKREDKIKTILDDGSLFISEADKKDSGNYTCSLENTSNDVEALVKVFVRTPPPPLVNVTIHPSTILALILWNVDDDGGYPIINFTAQYRLHAPNETWKPISPNHISPNSRQIDVYKLEPDTYYDFQIWATNQLGRGEIVEVTARTLDVYTEKVEQARRLLAGAENFDSRIWLVAVAIVMGTFVVLGLGTCFLLYQECRVPGATDEQEVIELVPNIILNPGFDDNSHTERVPADENSNNETTIRLNNNTVVQPRNM